MTDKELKSLAQYPNGIYCMGTDIRCDVKPMSYIVHITHKGRNQTGNQWVRMHDNLHLWGNGCDVEDIKESAVSVREIGECHTFYSLCALFPKEA
jgi:hypothetical protein